jgi:hypothetical protein
VALLRFPLGVRVQPGDANKGIFIKLTSGPGAGESYQITHPVASVNGLLRGSPYATICESVGLPYVACADVLMSWVFIFRP